MRLEANALIFKESEQALSGGLFPLREEGQVPSQCPAN